MSLFGLKIDLASIIALVIAIIAGITFVIRDDTQIKSLGQSVGYLIENSQKTQRSLGRIEGKLGIYGDDIADKSTRIK